GGIWLLRTPYPEPVTALAGEQPALETSRRLLGVPRWGREGSSRVRGAAVADPALIRRLDVGQAAYIYRGGVTFVQVKRLIAAPAALAGPLVADRAPPPADADQARQMNAVGSDIRADAPLRHEAPAAADSPPPAVP